MPSEIHSLQINRVSLVRNPATRKRWLLLKSADTAEDEPATPLGRVLKHANPDQPLVEALYDRICLFPPGDAQRTPEFVALYEQYRLVASGDQVSVGEYRRRTTI